MNICLDFCRICGKLKGNEKSILRGKVSVFPRRKYKHAAHKEILVYKIMNDEHEITFEIGENVVILKRRWLEYEFRYYAKGKVGAVTKSHVQIKGKRWGFSFNKWFHIQWGPWVVQSAKY